MAKKEYSLAHTKWMCKYHIVFTPKYRRKIIYNQYKADIRDILKQLCSYKGVEIIEGLLKSIKCCIGSTGLSADVTSFYINRHAVSN